MKINDEERELERVLNHAEAFRQEICNRANAPPAEVVERNAFKQPIGTHRGG